MSVLELTNITRVFERGLPVLDGVDLTIEAGQVVGLLGQNGAGKTTLMRIALGMLRPQTGTVRVFGLDPCERPVEVKRRVGYVSEDQVLPPYLRVKEVLALHRSLYPSWDADFADELLGRFSFQGKEKIAKLSKGQARRVAVTCALAHRPELLLLDEPAGGFDPAARREFLETALQLLADEGSAVLFSSHHMSDVERIAGRVAVLDRGQKIVDRDLDELRESTTLAVLAANNGVVPLDLKALDGCLGARIVRDELHGLFLGSPEAVRSRIASVSATQSPRFAAITLEDLFIELVEGRR